MKIVRKLFSAVLAVSMMSTLFASYASAEISGTPLIAIDASEYTGTAGETFNLYVNVTGIETSKTDNNNLTGVSDFTLEVVLPEGLTINVEDGTDPYEIYDEIDSNAARYGAADAAASSFLNNVFSYSCTFKRRLTQTDTGVYLTLPVTVVTVPTEEVEIGFGPKTMVIFKEYTAGSQTDILELGYANDPTPYKTAKIGKTAEPEIKINDKYVFNFTADADQDVMVKLTRTNGIVSDLTYALPELVKGQASIFGLLKVTDNTVVSGDKFDISVVDANRNPVKEITSIVVD